MRCILVSRPHASQVPSSSLSGHLSHIPPDGYHIYRDSTGFSYDITLARADLTSNKNERYYLKVSPFRHFPTPVFPSFTPPGARAFIVRPRLQRLQLYETHTAPNLYATYVKYSSPGKSATHVLCPTGSTFEMALSNFQAFFKIKTRKAWDQRLASVQVDEDAFVYTPPPVGLPKGSVPIDPDKMYGDTSAGFW